MKLKSLLLAFGILTLIACTTSFAVKNRALVLSAEKFDNEVLAIAKDSYVDLEQQKVFADFIKKYSRIDVNDVDIKGDDATAEMVIHTPARSIYPELKTISGKDWKAKADTAMENRTYALTLKNVKGSWEIVDQKELSKK
jgi:hypothetical protein